MRIQTKNPSSGALTGTGLIPGARERAQGQLAAGGVRNTKDRDELAMELRAGPPAVGCMTRDAAGFLAAPTETEFKRPGELSGELTAISLF